ncbi:MAG: alpha/beta hydrolase [Acetobacteraceae bacterium]|nr:alpha/beta hydrolase [Acetobacteraceae bacterium]
MPYVQARDGTPLHYNDWGSGPPVVLIHGWPLNADMWEYQSVPLGMQGTRVITYDRRGFGRSGQPWTGYDYNTLADDLAAVMDKLDLRGATLVGFSMGGGEVARYLSRVGTGRVAKAALVSAVTPYLLKTADNPDGVEKSVFDSIIKGLQEDRPHFLAGFGKTFFGAGLLNFTVTNEILQWALMMALQASPKATLDCAHAFAETDFRPDMAAFKLPTLIIHGAADETVPPEVSARRAAKMIPDARYIEYEGAPHALMFTNRDRLNQDLLTFVKG